MDSLLGSQSGKEENIPSTPIQTRLSKAGGHPSSQEKTATAHITDSIFIPGSDVNPGAHTCQAKNHLRKSVPYFRPGLGTQPLLRKWWYAMYVVLNVGWTTRKAFQSFTIVKGSYGCWGKTKHYDICIRPLSSRWINNIYTKCEQKINRHGAHDKGFNHKIQTRAIQCGGSQPLLWT